MIELKRIGLIFKRIRLRKKQSVRIVSENTQLSMQTIYSFESNGHGRINTLVILAEYYELTLDQWISLYISEKVSYEI